MAPESTQARSDTAKRITGGRLVARTLKVEGIKSLFTVSGGHVTDIYNGCADEGIAIIGVRHEQAAAHAADAWTRLTGAPGCAVVTAGPRSHGRSNRCRQRMARPAKRIPDILGIALREAYAGRPGPVYVETPTDLLFNEVDENEVINPSLYRTRGTVYGDFKLVDEATRERPRFYCC